MALVLITKTYFLQEIASEVRSQEANEEHEEGMGRRMFQVPTHDVPQHILNAVRNGGPNSGIYIAGGVLIMCPWLLTAPLLGLLGFSAAGPVAGGKANIIMHNLYTWLTFAIGSIAAMIQSTMSPVAAGSLFAILQSAGMGGSGAIIVNGATAAVGASVGAIAAISRFCRRRKLYEST